MARDKNRKGGQDGESGGPDSEAIDGAALWQYVTRSIRPLRREIKSDTEDAETMARGRGKTEPNRQKAGPAEISRAVRGEGRKKAPPSPGDTAIDISVDRRTEDRLRRGQMEIEATIDLHGMSAAQAQAQLERFLLTEHARGLRCVLVITGKGGRNGNYNRGDAFQEKSREMQAGQHDFSWLQPGILRRSLPEWVARPPLSSIVLRHFPAKGRHGGNGAFYILLRRKR